MVEWTLVAPWVLATLLVAGCGRDAIGVADGSVGGEAAAPLTPDAPSVPAATKLDVLFVIDNSGGMVDVRRDLPQIIAAFTDPLRALPAGLPDLHVGVVTSDLGAGSRPLASGGCPKIGGDRGILQARPACGLDPGARFLSSARSGTVNNFTGSMEQAFACIAAVGAAGCGYEHQLQATRVALHDDVTPENRGFLRDDAVLAIVIVSDEDDCSADPDSDLFTDDASFPNTTLDLRCAQVGHLCNGVAPPLTPFDVPLASCQANPGGRLIEVRDVVASIRALKTRPDQQILVAGIFGWPLDSAGARYQYIPTNQGAFMVPICQSMRGEAAVGLRLKSFVESFGPSGFFVSICDPDFRPTFQRLGQAVAARF
jgi:hypothetical protein